MKKRLLIGITLLILLSTYKIQEFFFSNKFNIGEIIVENNFILKDKEIIQDLVFLYNANLFFLKTSKIKKILKKRTFIESFELKKIYPNKLIIKVYEKKPIAILQFKKKRFFINENIDLIDYMNLENYRNLPLIFGDKKNFAILYKRLKEINFPINTIKKYYLYESNRWDLETYKNKVIKLPEKNYLKSLENFMNLRKKNNFNNYKVFDYRINSQLILK